MEIISYKYSIPYVTFVLFLIVLLFVEFRQMNKGRGTQFLRYTIIISFSLFFGLKGLAGADTIGYYNFFTKLPTIWQWNFEDFMSPHWEIGFKFYSVILKSICPNFFFFSFVSVLIDALILNIVIKRYSKYYVLAFLVYTAFYGQIFEMEQIRNVKAVMLFLLSLKYVEQNRFLPYLLLNLVALSFHNSAILYVVIYPFLKKQFSATFYFTIFAIGFCLFVFQIEYIKPIFRLVGQLLGGGFEARVNIYLASEIYGRDAFALSLNILERGFAYLLFCVFFRKKLLQADEQNTIMINIFVLCFISSFYLAEIEIAIVRIVALFIPAYMFLYSNVLYEIQTRWAKQLLLIGLIIYSCYRMASYTKYIEYNYKNVLFQKENIEVREKRLDESYKYKTKDIKKSN